MTAAETDERQVVFVYGRLLQASPEHYRLQGAEYVGCATVRGRLYHIDGRAGVELDRSMSRISGELYNVTKEQMEDLDAYTGKEFERVLATVDIGEFEPETAWVWEWRGDLSTAQRVKSGQWLDVFRPRATPLFNWMAWSPVIVFPVIGGFFASRGGMPLTGPAAEVLEMLAYGSIPMVMTASSWISLRRAERGAEWAILALVLGILGMLGIGFLILVMVTGLWRL